MNINSISTYDIKEAVLVIKRFGLLLRKKNLNKLMEEVFYNLCFAILAPQTTFKNNIKAIKALREYDFYKVNLDINDLQKLIKPTRFYRIKSDRLIRLKKQFSNILIVMLSNAEDHLKREFLVKNVKGLGMKAASHFLRNMGCKNLAIIDTHVLKFLECETPKTKGEYLAIERKFKNMAKKLDLYPAELDAIVWKEYSGTPWEKFVY